MRIGNALVGMLLGVVAAAPLVAQEPLPPRSVRAQQAVEQPAAPTHNSFLGFGGGGTFDYFTSRTSTSYSEALGPGVEASGELRFSSKYSLLMVQAAAEVSWLNQRSDTSNTKFQSYSRQAHASLVLGRWALLVADADVASQSRDNLTFRPQAPDTAHSIEDEISSSAMVGIGGGTPTNHGFVGYQASSINGLQKGRYLQGAAAGYTLVGAKGSGGMDIILRGSLVTGKINGENVQLWAANGMLAFGVGDHTNLYLKAVYTLDQGKTSINSTLTGALGVSILSH